MEKRGFVLIVVVALALVFIPTQLKADDVPAELEVFYNNTPPILLENIPDQYLAINIPTINSFDLDDYFFDNETLTYNVSYLGDQNVTVTIDSENKVSFYPDNDFNGSINITFLAFDTFVTTESNIVEIFVTDDTQPPQWDNPRTFNQGTIIYQNVFVNFTVDWSDDFGLDNFVFMINEGAGWVSKTAEPMTGTSNQSKYRVQISSAGGTVYWKVGAYDLSGNYNETEVQNITVEPLPAPPEGEDDDETDTGTRTPRVGAGYAPAPPPSAGEEISGFTVTPESFNIDLKQDSSVTVTLKITNIGTQPLEFAASAIGLEVLKKTVSEEIFNISAGESKTISVMFESTKETLIDQYYGKIEIVGGEEVVDVPVAVTVRAAITDIEIDLEVLEDFKEVRAGETVKANITIENVGELDTKTITLYYAVKDFVGNIVDAKTEDFELSQKQIDFVKELNIPEEVPVGEYIFFARATAKDDTNIASDTFLVGSRFTVWGFIRTNLLIILIVTASMIVALLMVKHYRNQERLRLLNLYIMITNLKKLLKEGEIEKAIKLYIRIKSSYGQPVSRSAMQNKDALKQEMEKLTEKLHSPEAIKVQKEAEKETGESGEKKEGEVKKEPEKDKEKPDGEEETKEEKLEPKEPEKEEKPKDEKKEEPKQAPENKEEKPAEQPKEEKPKAPEKTEAKKESEEKPKEEAKEEKETKPEEKPKAEKAAPKEETKKEPKQTPEKKEEIKKENPSQEPKKEEQNEKKE